MKERQTEQRRQTREHSLWYAIVTVALPLFALLLAAVLIAFCISSITVRPVLTIELGDESPDASAFLNREGSAAYVTAPEPCYQTAGNRLLRIDVNGRVRPVVLRVRDTIAPWAEGTETTVSVHESPAPDKLIKNLKDKSIVKVTFVTAPNYGTVGDWDAIVGLEDMSGNRSEVPVTVHVRRLRESVTIEAGDPAPTADDFLLSGVQGTMQTELTEQMLREPGNYPIAFFADGETAESLLIVEDTVAPKADAKTRIAHPGDPVLPEELIENITDATTVTCAFLNAPDPDSRALQSIAVKLCDLGGNETVVSSTLLFSDVAPVTLEASGTALEPEAILPEGTYETAAFSEPFVPDTVGTHAVPMRIDGEDNVALIEVKDTVAPVLTLKSEQWYLNAKTDPEQFVDVSDATETTLSFLTEPDWTKSEQEVAVLCEDGGKNRASIRFTLTLAPDTDAPVLYGVKDRNRYVNEPVAYLSEVSAVDACDGEVEVTVDASGVDPSRTGSYPVIYTATDRAGNTVSKRVTFRFLKTNVSEQRAREVADRIIGRIFTDDMDIHAKIRAIYDYVFSHVHYVSKSNKQDWRGEAVRGLTQGKGDCFTFYSAARLLLEQTDAEILSVERLGGATRHYWLLVNVGSGWYHFDACNAGKGKNRCFMWTTAQTTAVSKSFWRFDESLYPPVATEPYDPEA